MYRTASFVIVLGAIFCLVAEGLCQPIKVGLAIDLTGPHAVFGIGNTKGHRDYLQYVNEVKGGVAGRRIELIVYDTTKKTSESIAAIKKFAISDKVDMISTWGSEEGITAKPFVREYKIPTINYATPWEIMEPPVDYMYLPFGTVKLDVAEALEYIRVTHRGKEAPKVGLLAINVAFGKSIHKPFKENAERQNIDLVSIEEFDPRALDVSTELLRMKAKGIAYIYLQIAPVNLPIIFRSADRIGYDPRFFSTFNVIEPDTYKLGKGLIRSRLKIHFCGGLPIDGTPGVRLFEEVNKRYKSTERFDISYWHGFVIAMLMERAFQRAHEKFGKINPETINNAMESFDNEDFGGLFPNVSYSKTNHEGSFRGRIVQVNEDGNFSPLTNFFTPGKEKLQVLK